MRLKTLVVVLLGFTGSVNNVTYAQKQGQARIDSLKEVAAEMGDDSIKAKLLANIALQYPPIKPDIGIQYAEEALQLATKLAWKKGISSAYSSMAANYNAKSDRAKVLEYLLKALKIQEETNDRMGIASSMNNIGIVYEDQGNYDKALEYFLKGIKLQEELGNSSGVAISSGNIATIYFHKKEYGKALAYI